MSLNEYHNDIRRLINKNKKRHGYGGFLFAYQIGRDEIYDPSLISQRVYHPRNHGDIVRIASGVSFAHDQLPKETIILPKLAQIIALQRKYGVTHAF